MDGIGRIGIIGGAGFAGLNIAAEAMRAGIGVVLFDRAPPPPLFARLHGEVPFRQVDIVDPASLGALRSAGLDAVVFAAAATSGPAREAAEPERVLSINLLGFVNALRAARDAGVRRIMNLSSVAAYGAAGRPEDMLLEDGTPSRPKTLYAISKLATEVAGQRLGQLWDMDVRAVRLSSLYGPWERATGVRDTLSPHHQMMTAAAEGRPALLPHDGLRDWTYAPDAAAAVIALIGIDAPRHRLHNVSRGATSSALEFGLALRARWPGFECRLAEPGETPTIDMQIAGDRESLSIHRLASEIGAAADFRDPLATVLESADWLAAHREAGA